MAGPSHISLMRGTAASYPVSESDESDARSILDHGGPMDDEEEDSAQWTINTFKSRPIGGETNTNTIRSLHTKLREPLDRIDETLRQYGEVAAAIADCDEKHHVIRHVQTQFLSTLETKYLIQIRIDVLKSLEELMRTGEAVEKIEEVYEQECNARVEEWSAKSERTKYKTDKQFEGFRMAIWEKNHPDEPLGPVARYLQRDQADESDSEDEVEAGGTVRNFACPLTRTILRDAHTSRICGHSYTGEYILDALRKAKKKGLKCPMAGCAARLTPQDVLPDPSLQKMADAYAKKQEHRQRETARQHDDDDEVVSQ